MCIPRPGFAQSSFSVSERRIQKADQPNVCIRSCVAPRAMLLCWPLSEIVMQVIITKLKLDKDRKELLERKKGASTTEKGKGKFSEAEVQAMQDVD